MADGRRRGGNESPVDRFHGISCGSTAIETFVFGFEFLEQLPGHRTVERSIGNAHLDLMSLTDIAQLGEALVADIGSTPVPALVSIDSPSSCISSNRCATSGQSSVSSRPTKVRTKSNEMGATRNPIVLATPAPKGTITSGERRMLATPKA